MSKPFRIVVIGDSGVGKTTLVLRCISGKFAPNVGPTVLAKTYKQSGIDVDGETYDVEVIDTPGGQTSYLESADVILFVVDAGGVAPEALEIPSSNRRNDPSPEFVGDYAFDRPGSIISTNGITTEYDRLGYSRTGYNRRGYNRGGYDRHGYNRQGQLKDSFADKLQKTVIDSAKLFDKQLDNFKENYPQLQKDDPRLQFVLTNPRNTPILLMFDRLRRLSRMDAPCYTVISEGKGIGTHDLFQRAIRAANQRKHLAMQAKSIAAEKTVKADRSTRWRALPRYFGLMIAMAECIAVTTILTTIGSPLTLPLTLFTVLAALMHLTVEGYQLAKARQRYRSVAKTITNAFNLPAELRVPSWRRQFTRTLQHIAIAVPLGIAVAYLNEGAWLLFEHGLFNSLMTLSILPTIGIILGASVGLWILSRAIEPVIKESVLPETTVKPGLIKSDSVATKPQTEMRANRWFRKLFHSQPTAESVQQQDDSAILNSYAGKAQQ